MRRRDFLAAAGAAAVACGVGAREAASDPGETASQTSGGGSDRPDVLFLLTDQWNPRCLGFAGDEAVPTPNLDRLAAEGIAMEGCYTPCPVCMPARASLLSGQYPHNHHLWGNNSNYVLPPEIAPMFRDICAAGCTTAQIGKLHWTGGAAWRRRFESLDEYYQALGLDYCLEIATPFSTPSGKGPYQDHLRQIGRLDAYCRDIAERIQKGEYVPWPSAVEPKDHNDQFVADRAIDFLQAQPKEKPYCLVVSFPGPHPPMDAPGKYATMVPPESIQLPPNVPEKMTRDGATLDRDGLRRVRANYYGKMALIDDNVGRIIDVVKRRGTWDHTLVVFSADHGEMMGAHGAMSKGRFFEESGRVPLVMRWPGHIHGGRKSPALCQLFDVYPTIVEAVGGKLSGGHFARSLLPIALGKADSVRDAAQSEISNRSFLNYMVRMPDYVWWVHRGEESLYDMADDPYQMNNLIASAAHREVLQEIRLRHLEYFKSTQVNLSADYRPMMERMRERGGDGRGGLGEQLYEEFRERQGLDRGRK